MKKNNYFTIDTNYTVEKSVVKEMKKINSFTLPPSAKKFFLKRPLNSHKGDFGHLLIIAGSCGMTGCVSLTASASLRSGAGLVTCGVANSLLNIVANIIPTEAMTLPLPDKDGMLIKKSVNPILDFIKKRNINCCVIGPGLSQNNCSYDFLIELLKKLNLPVIIDADGLNNIAKLDSPVDFLKNLNFPIILTPHPGEFSRLIKKSISIIQLNRVRFVKDFAFKTKKICVLKGYKTVVSDGKDVYINSTGTPGLAKGGSGDVLSGIIGGLLTQNLARDKQSHTFPPVSLFEVVKISVFLHGLCANLSKINEYSLVATDLIKNIPIAIDYIQKLKFGH